MALLSPQSNPAAGVTEIEEAPAGVAVDGKVYVAVSGELKEGKSILLWALRNVSTEQRIVLLHVHQPAQMIPVMGGKFPVSKLKEQVVRVHRQLAREKMHKVLDEYLMICSLMKVQAEKLVIEMDDIEKGLVEHIDRLGITKIVMGAAADKHYSK